MWVEKHIQRSASYQVRLSFHIPSGLLGKPIQALYGSLIFRISQLDFWLPAPCHSPQLGRDRLPKLWVFLVFCLFCCLLLLSAMPLGHGFSVSTSNLMNPCTRQWSCWFSCSSALMKLPCWPNCCCSVAKLCPTLCDPMDWSTPGSPVLLHLPESAYTHVHWVGDAIQPSCPLLSPSPPVFNLSQHQGLLQRISSSHQAAKVLELQLQHQSFQWLFRFDFL